MVEFWKGAAIATGIGGIASFVLWSLYRDWLRLDVFQRMTKHQQFILFLTFLVLTFVFALAGLGTYAYVSTQSTTTQDNSPKEDGENGDRGITIETKFPPPPPLEIKQISYADFVVEFDKALHGGADTWNTLKTEYWNSVVEWECYVVSVIPATEEQNSSRGYRVEPQPGSPKSHQVRCFLSHAQPLRQFSISEKITIKGVITHIDNGGVMLSECELVTPLVEER